MDDLTWLSNWYTQQCDGGWEHQNGIKIETLDNPGWSLVIDVEGTALETRSFADETHGLDPHSSSSSWWVCKVEDTKFRAACGPHDLPSVLSRFRKWAETQIRPL